MSTTTPRVLTLLASGDEMAEAIIRLQNAGLLTLHDAIGCECDECLAIMAAAMWDAARLDTKTPAAESVLAAGVN